MWNLLITFLFLFKLISTNAFEYGREAQFSKAPSTTQPETACLAGYVLDGNVCVLQEFAEPIYGCDKKGLMKDGKCIYKQEEDKITNCPHGSVFDGKRCQITESTTPITTCPKGYSPINSKLNHKGAGEGCISQEILKQVVVCPEHYSPTKHGKCIKLISSLSHPVCPDGFVIQTIGGNKHTECVQVEILAQQLSCPPQYVVEGNSCVIRSESPTIAECPVGYKLENDICTIANESLPDVICPHGYKSDANRECVVYDTIQPTNYCRRGFTLTDNRCVKNEQIGLIYTCPDGFRMSDSKCVSRSYFEADYVCPPGSVQEGKFCIEVLKSPLNISCANGEIGPDNLCVYLDHLPPKTVCPNDYTKHDGKCIMHKNAPPELICENGILEGEFCIKKFHMPSEVFCKENGHISHGNSCKRTYTKIHDLLCPPEYKLQGNECISVKYDNLILSCPHNNTPHGKHCEAARPVEPLKICPKDYLLDNTGNCFMSEFAEPKIKCPSQYKMMQGHCVSIENSHSKLR